MRSPAEFRRAKGHNPVVPENSLEERPAPVQGLLSDRFVRWRMLTVALIVTGYAGYYLCRSDLAVAMPLLITEMGRRGIAPDDARIRLGTIASLGVRLRDWKVSERVAG